MNCKYVFYMYMNDCKRYHFNLHSYLMLVYLILYIGAYTPRTLCANPSLSSNPHPEGYNSQTFVVYVPMFLSYITIGSKLLSFVYI